MTEEEKQDVRCVVSLCKISIELIQKGKWGEAVRKLKTAHGTAKIACQIHETKKGKDE